MGGYITRENLREVLGDTYDGEPVEAFISEADNDKDGCISFPEFESYIRAEQHAASIAPLLSPPVGLDLKHVSVDDSPLCKKPWRSRDAVVNADADTDGHQQCCSVQ